MSKFSIDDVPEEHRGGNCFEASFEFIRGCDDGWELVHGIVKGQGVIEGIPIVHAWCELGDLVYDGAADVYIHKEKYYKVGEIEHTVKYSRNEAIRKAIETELYGCWDEELAKKGVMG